MKEATEKTLSMWLSFLAIIFSGVSLWVSYESWKTTNKDFQVNLQPILGTEFKIDNGKQVYVLILVNKGPNTIYDLNIETFTRLVDLENRQMPIQAGGPVGDLEKNKKLEPGETYTIPITEFIDNAAKMKDYSRYKKDENYQIFFSFYFSFRRLPDKKQFEETRTLLITRAEGTGQLIVIDPYKTMKFKNETINDLEKLFSH
ncbi:MAG: hypothetical protein E3K36_12840 [Candidatus Brocadia sp.]|nr:hypothetical protein [Candidatus Brocadia sp.]